MSPSFSRPAAVWVALFSLVSLAQARKAAPAAAPSTQVTVSAPGEATTADEAFDAQMRTMEEQVDDLKEKIFRSKARLLLLQETVIGGDLSAGARAVLVHRNEMGSTFQLQSAAYALDGAAIFTKLDVNGDLSKREEIEIFNGRIVPGEHQIAVRLLFRGHGFGLFSYLEGYKFKVQSSYTFTAEPGKVTELKIVGFDKGGITTELKDRPAIRYDLQVTPESAVRPASGSPLPPAK